MEITTRKANEDDAAAIAAIGRQSFSDAFEHLFINKQELKEYLDYTYNPEKIANGIRKENNAHFISFVDGVAAGFLKLKKQSTNKKIESPVQMELQKIYVIKKYHGSGAGKQLMAAALNLAEEIKTGYIWLNVHISNERAIQVYKKNGFLIAGRHFYAIGNQTFEFHLMATPVALKESLNQ